MKKNLSAGYLLDFYGPLLTERQRDALDMYYNMDYSLAEIADSFGVTRQCVRGFILQGERRLQQMEAAIGHAALYGAVAELLPILQSYVEEEPLQRAAARLAACMERETDGV